MENEKSMQDLSKEIIEHNKKEAVLIHQLIAPDIDPLFLDLSSFKDWYYKLVKEKERFENSSEGCLSHDLLCAYETLLSRYVQVLKNEIRLKRIHMPGGHDIIRIFN